jgi:MerR family transcriptional regulator, thiopeptide resistance regulator
MSYSVGQVARFAGVTVRTLHHYDEIGLLVPSARSAAGHRRYDDRDLDRLQRILFYRELGFPLEEIGPLADDNGAHPMEQLRRRHRLLTERIERLRTMAVAVEQAMEAQKMGVQLTPEEKFEVFGEQYREEYEQEAQQRWGDTEAWAESQRRAARYTKEDWQRIKAEADGIHQRLAAALTAGLPADHPTVRELAEEHRRHICGHFYECGYEMHRGLGEMYITDERFTATYEAIHPGLAAYLHAAITANADAAG